MNKSGKNIRYVAIVLIAISSITAHSAVLAVNQDPKLRLEVSNESNKLLIAAGEDLTTCTVSGLGGICMDKGHAGKITFFLQGNKSCADIETGAKWELTRVLLGGEGSRSKPDPLDDAEWGGLSKGAAEDFNANPATGLVATTSPTNAGKITIEDDNNHEVALWFKVEAQCKKDDVAYKTILLDPRIRNGGDP